MSVKQYTNGRLSTIAGPSADKTFTGTTAQVMQAIADGVIKEDYIVYITDDVNAGAELLDSYEEIMSNTDQGKAAGALGVKEGFEKALTGGLQWYIDNGWLPAIPAEGEVPANLEDCSWHMIQQLVAADTFKNYYKVGDTKSVTLSSGEVVYMQVASINDGSGDAGAWYPKGTVDFISKDCLQTSYVMNTSSAYVGWSSTEIRSTLNTSILNTLPIDLQNTIIEKTHKTSATQMESSLVEHSDKLWLPSEYEVFGSKKIAHAEECIPSINRMYAIFTDNSSRIKHYGTNGEACSWRCCSPMFANVSVFCHVTSAGAGGSDTSYYQSSKLLGIPLCFRVG